AGQSRQKQSFAAEDGRLDSAGELDVVVDGLVESDDAAGVYLQRLAGLEIEMHEVAASVDEHHAGTRELFQNESFTAEESRAQLLDEGHAKRHAVFSANKGVTLGEKGLSW